MKSFARFLLFIVFAVSFFYFTLVFSLNQTVFSGPYLKNKLAKKGFYARLYGAIPEIINSVSGDETAIESDQNTVTANQLGKIILGGTDAATLQAKGEKLIDDFDAWLNTSTGSSIVISLSDIKERILKSEAAQLNVPIELLRSGDIGFVVPDSYTIPMPPELQSIRQIKQAGSSYLLLSLFISVAALLGFVLLRSGNWAYKVRSLGEALFWTGLLTFIFFGSFWVFFAAGDLLYKSLAGNVKISQDNVAYLYSLARSILDDFEVRALAGSVMFIIFGITAWIVGKIFIKKTQKAFVPSKEEKVEKTDS